MSDLALPATFGRYTLLERVGGGGMAQVYRAALSGEAGFEKELAVKVVRPELATEPQFVEMFLDEARLSARLNHANLVHTFDFGQVDGTWFLAMEFVRGPTLAKLLRICRARGVPLGAARSVHVAGEVARGLGYAHRLFDEAGAPLGLVHRDVSPQNVLLSREGEVKLADFGIAKAAWRSTVTRTGHVRGKIAYMAPEQARGEPLDARTDVFALGVVLWESLTGQALFDGSSDGAVLLQVMQREIPPPSRLCAGVPPELDALVLRMLARDRRLRPANGDEVAREIAALKLRLVRAPEEADLAAFQRRLASGTAVLEAAGRGGVQASPAPPDGEAVELDSAAIVEAASQGWFDPAAETLVPGARQEPGVDGAPALTTTARARAPRPPAATVPSLRVPEAGAERGATIAREAAAPTWELARERDAGAGGGHRSPGRPRYGGAAAAGAAAVLLVGAGFWYAGTQEASGGYGAPAADEKAALEADRLVDGAPAGQVGLPAAQAGAEGTVPEPLPGAPAGGRYAAAGADADAGAGAAEARARRAGDESTEGDGRGADERRDGSAAGGATIGAVRIDGPRAADDEARRAGRGSAAPARATVEAPRQRTPAVPPAGTTLPSTGQRAGAVQPAATEAAREAPEPAELVITNRIGAPASAALDGRAVGELPPTPLRLQTTAGPHELVYRQGADGKPCRLRFEIEASGRFTILIESTGAFRIEDRAKVPLRCQ